MQCSDSGCKNKAVFHLSWIENRRCAHEQHLCEEHGRAVLASYVGPSSPFSGTRKFIQDATQLEIGLVAIWESQDQQAIYLHTLGEPHLVPITTGIFEATALDRILKGYPSPRPLTHDTFAASIRLLGGEVQDIVIQRLEDRIYYVNARIRTQGNLLLLDLRPSDALVLAVLFDCPIFVGNEVLGQIDRQGNIK